MAVIRVSIILQWDRGVLETSIDQYMGKYMRKPLKEKSLTTIRKQRHNTWHRRIFV